MNKLVYLLSKGELVAYKLHLNDILEENSQILASQQTSEIIKVNKLASPRFSVRKVYS